MLKASALYIVVVISLILAVFCSALIMSSYYYRLSLVGHNIDDQLWENVYSASNLVLEQPEIAESGAYILDLFGKGRDSVEIQSGFWGVFRWYNIRAFKGRKSKQKAFLAGYPLKGKFKSALYLADQNRPVSVCGNTIIKGTCHLPKAGIQRAYIGGKSFTGDKLVDGKVLQSESGIPKLNGKNSLVEYMQGLGNYKKINFVDLDLDVPLINSFSDSTILIYSSFPINLSASLSGNIIIRSESEIRVSSSSKLEDVLLVAPYIGIQNNFEGSIQIMGSDSIHIGKRVKLQYPSSVNLIQRSNPLANSAIQIDAFTECKGVVNAIKQTESRYECTVKLQPESKVEGQVYSEGYADIQGSIEGNLTADKVIFKNAYSTYVNHFMDARLNEEALSGYFAGSGLGSGPGLKLVKWVE